MRYLDMHAAAAHLGVAYATIRRYRATGGFPDADVVVGQSPGWLAETIDAWQASRPGRGTGGGRPKAIVGALPQQDPDAGQDDGRGSESTSRPTSPDSHAT